VETTTNRTVLDPSTSKECNARSKPPDLAAVRGNAIAKLPEAERQQWQKLWDDVEALRKRAAEKK
jgi:hypothetical protein